MQIPSTYEGTFSKDSSQINGKVTTGDSSTAGDEDDEDAVSFTLALVKDDPSHHSDDNASSSQSKGATTNSISALAEGKKYSGMAQVEYPFNIKITKRKGAQVEGTIKWTLQKCKTKFKVNYFSLLYVNREKLTTTS